MLTPSLFYAKSTPMNNNSLKSSSKLTSNCFNWADLLPILIPLAKFLIELFKHPDSLDKLLLADTTKKKKEPKPPSPEVSRTNYSRGAIVTVKHDGHLFIVEGRYEKGAIIHHPDCPCKNANK